MNRSLKTVKSNPLAGRIKKVMQTDEDVGKIAQGAPLLLARAMEPFLGELCEGTAAVATNSHARTATPSHLKAFVTSTSKMDFLADKVASVPDIAEEDTAPAKKQRSDIDLASSSSGLQLSGTTSPPSTSKAGRGKGRGRTRGRGSVRLAASEGRACQSKHDPDSTQAAPSISESKPLHDSQATAANPGTADASTSAVAMPQAAAPDVQLTFADSKTKDAEMATSLVDFSSVQDQPDPAVADNDAEAPATAATAPQQLLSPQTLSVAHQQAAAASIPTAGASLKRLETFAEEDDYDADD